MDILLKIIACFIIIIVLLLMAAIIKTLTVKSKKSTYFSKNEPDREALYAKKLSQMVQVETISSKEDVDLSKFYKFHKVLEDNFPLLHSKLEKVDIDGNLLFKWKGQSDKNPILLMSHMDVVEATGKWQHEPFSGDIADGRVWGRGSCDTKCSLMAIMQAVEELLAADYIPQCDVYIASSCTEEVAGDGGPKIVNYLKSKNVRLFMVSDEGGAITSNPLPGVKGYFAMVGVYEKGTGHINFVAKSKGGHASAPSKNSPIHRLSKLVCHIEKHSPFKAYMSKEVEEMFARLAPYCSFPLKMVFSNMWLFKPLLVLALPSLSPTAAAMLKTTIAFTMQEGSKAFNVIPESATLSANLRYIPYQQKEESLALLKEIAAKYNVEMENVFSFNPTKPVDIEGKAFKLTEEAIANCFEGAGCCPYVVTGATDARFYEEIADACIRFSPIIYDPQQLKSMHGIDENLFTNALPGAVDYYKYIIKAQQ
ncbi:MAG: M20/M25/M40 family metallo-hydrolase [Christensenellaceae bacterium]|nr:M20/M25/M40 family metallo-hydrolase [Christensenellaceae bacterium]